MLGGHQAAASEGVSTGALGRDAPICGVGWIGTARCVRQGAKSGARHGKEGADERLQDHSEQCGQLRLELRRGDREQGGQHRVERAADEAQREQSAENSGTEAAPNTGELVNPGPMVNLSKAARPRPSRTGKEGPGSMWLHGKA